MQKNRIGNTGVAVTPICFGTSALGDMPDTYGYSVNEDRAQATLDAIFDGPANFLDTSNNYGMGESEKRIGEAIKRRGGIPEGFVISTKLDRDMDTLKFDAGRARKSLEESLTRLNLDRVQMLHLHDPEHAADLEEIRGKGGAIEELFKMKEEGLADSVGLAMGRIDMQFPLIREFPFDAIISHNRYTLLNRSADEMFDYAHAQGMAILNAAPYAGGVLAKGPDEMKKITYQDADEASLEPVRRLQSVCEEHGVGMGAVALQFSMRDPRIASTILGVSKPERVDQAVAWANEPVPDALWEAIEDFPYSREDPEANRVYSPG